MRPGSKLVLVLSAFLCAGCYHQVVQTGATPAPGTAAVTKTANLYFFGLAGAEVDATVDCPTGVAIIETRQTFLNGLLGVLTLGIYTPRTVTLTCASGEQPIPDGLLVTIGSDASAGEAGASARRAVELARRSHDRVVLLDLR